MSLSDIPVTDRPLLLVLRPLPYWGIVIAELKQVTSYGRFMMVERSIRSDQWASERCDTMEDERAKALCDLARHCEKLQPSMLYQKKANRQLFKHEKDFWATDDSFVKQHIKRLADLLLTKAVRLAARLTIPTLYMPTEKAPLHLDDRLLLDDETRVTPFMSFTRHDEGIDYQLGLRIDDELLERLTDHQLIVLCYEPALFVLDGRILHLEEGFSAKLLIPFIQKAVVRIPKKMERDYFRRFILKNVAKAEVSATGFDIEDARVEPQPRLVRESTIAGRHILSLRFRYGDIEYTSYHQSPGQVTLQETEGEIRFRRQLRDLDREQTYTEQLRDVSQLSEQGTIAFASLSQLIDWLRQYGKQLRAQGFDIIQPSDELYYIGPLAVEQSDHWQGDWLQTEVTILLDGGRLQVPFSDLRTSILNGEQEYMLPTGERLLIPREWLERYDQLLLLGKQRGKGFLRHRSQLTPTTDGPSESVMPSVPLSTQAVAPPARLKATLRPYQQVGYEWLWHHFEARTGCCLSDEMGLGKTVQTIALLLRYKDSNRKSKEKQPQQGFLFTEEEMSGTATAGGQDTVTGVPYATSLVLAPASVVHNWRNELQRFAPCLTVCDYTGTAAQRQKKRGGLMRWDVVVTTYQTLVKDIDFLAPLQFGIVVFDESQNFKNSSSLVHQSVKRLMAYHQLALSGTPVENNLTELWSLMNVINPFLLGEGRHFQDYFVKPITSELESKRTAVLRQLISPYFLKRTKEEVLTDLPERQDEVVVCPMTEEQISQYATELSKARNEWLTEDQQTRTISVLAAIHRLRQIANGEGKMGVVFEQLENLRSTQHKVLIFSEYVRLLEQVADEMGRRGWMYDMLTGETQHREQVITHFQQSGESQFFLISLKAGGVGINLTVADYVFILDPWWNLSAEEQAIARSHRIGQHHPVFVYRFVSADTLEEQILTLQERKQTLIDSVMPFILKS